MNQKTSINTIIFDLGGVLVDWNPKYLYRKIFDSETKINEFLSEICTNEWNIEHDRGRPLWEGTQLLVDQYPQYEQEIRAYYGRWVEMLGGLLDETVEILEKLKEIPEYRIYALTNWSHETFAFARVLYPFLQLFEGIVVSGEEKVIKPDARIYEILLERFEVKAEEAVFIDDSLKNVKGAEAVGIKGIHFSSPQQLKVDLEKLLEVEI
ncbi:MAG: HAD family phosphatase [Chitinophagales bacterium]